MKVLALDERQSVAGGFDSYGFAGGLTTAIAGSAVFILTAVKLNNTPAATALDAAVFFPGLFGACMVTLGLGGIFDSYSTPACPCTTAVINTPQGKEPLRI